MNKHTPPLWIVDFQRDEYDSASSILRVIDSRSLDHPQGPLTIATVNVAAHAPHLDEPLANAALISASPLLLNALIDLLEQADLGEVDEETRPIVENARVAIRIATRTID